MEYTEQVISALKAIIKSLLIEDYTKTSYPIRDHVKYIKNILLDDHPELHIRYTAKKLFPNLEAYFDKLAHIENKYSGKEDLILKFEALFTLYFQISQEKIERRKATLSEAESILDELLA